MQLEEITEAFPHVQSIAVYVDGKRYRYGSGSMRFERIMETWEQTVKDCRPMPAYGVALDKETREAMQKGVWLEMQFGEKMSCSEMYFESLLLSVDRAYTGTNLIRYTENEGYFGRCYYLDLEGDMTALYEILVK